ncbi:MAG: hypothetical protein SGPRY_010040, partial [Prymnesium sp.]
EARERVNNWFASFDVNHSGVLEREQLSALLEYLTHKPADEQAIELVMRKAVEIDTTGDGLADTTGLFAHLKRKRTENQFDTNQSGLLEKTQLRMLLKKVSSCPVQSSFVISSESSDNLLHLMKVSPDKTIHGTDVDYVLELCDEVRIS